MNEQSKAVTPDALDAESQHKVPGFRLDRLEILNWGTFDAKVWCLDLNGKNMLLTGDIGSGKSTLVDAITTLLVPHNRINYNKAAGADTRERDLKSYVLGYYKSEKGETGGSAKPVAIRDHNSYSVVLAHFHNADFGSDVTLAQVFWLKDYIGQPERFYCVADRKLSICEDFGDFGSEIATLKKRLKADKSSTEIFDSFPPYGAAFRRRFGIETEQALELFHQTVSMKSVGNLTEFVRSHMLEPFDAESRIKALVAHFDDLTRAHEAVLKAKQQIALLTPLVADCDNHVALSETIAGFRECRDTLRAWFAEQKAAFLTERLTKLQEEIESLTGKVSALDAQREAARQAQRDIEKAISANGGDRLRDLRDAISKAASVRDDRQRRATKYDETVSELKFPAVTDLDMFQANLKRLQEERELAKTRQAQVQNRRIEAEVSFQAVKQQHEALALELDSLRKRPSNIPKHMLDLRDALCESTGLTAEALPFVGELIQVSEDALEWEGAAERLLHGFALSLLVPDIHYTQVAEWVDRTHLRGKLVYFRVRDFQDRSVEPPSFRALYHKLEIRTGTAFERWLDVELTRRADHICCDTIGDFRREVRAVTKTGQTKDKNGRHEKDDRRNINDRTHYVLGWSNAAKISALETQHADLVRNMQAFATQIAFLQSEVKAPEERLQRLSKLETWTDFQDIDWRTAAREMDRLEKEKKAFEASSDILRTLETQLAEATKRLEKAESACETARSTLAVKKNGKQEAELSLDMAIRDRDGTSPDTRARNFPKLEEMQREALGVRNLNADTCDRAEAEMREWLQKKKIDTADGRLTNLRDRIIGAMSRYRIAYPLDTREVDDHLDAAPEYRRMLTNLIKDDLPRFEKEFKRQLNENAIREVANFQSQLMRESADIEERVALINQSLADIDYNPGRFIRLEAEQTQDVDIRQFRQDLRTCTEGTLTGSDEDGYSEAKFLHVKQIVERFRGREGLAELDKRWTRKVTDMRNWFVFSASERWREDQSEHEHYTDSGGKSGGQKEKLAYTVLAASLAYQFGLEWTSGPSRTFRFVVIDEAFGRGSDKSARYGLRLFRKLGLQLLVVTPLQKIHIIEPFVSGVGFVHNPAGDRSLLRTLTVEEFRQERDSRGHV
ncbi:MULTISPECIES: ATP-binding protein [Kordiimonas]|jgi:uncharacterized protein YPO0396|uniref:ATP-binding protein n=1 Tax=Kordiimonas TaxID=288021 RepID=UPI002581116C|nr:ATP-binding protein [Kordiimonas sp. UBA4487]